MTVQYFRLLLIVSFVIGVIGGGIDLVFPELLPEKFHEAQGQYAQYDTFSTSFLLFLIGSAIAIFVVAIVSFYGLYRLRPWAPRLSLVFTSLALLFLVFAGPSAQSGIAVAACYLSSYIWGAVIVFAFFAPFNAHFRRGNG
ncbi:hypothetical protein [Herminiimonas arsenitoxidans]|uniref:hypothetical protein n=1 Tax=Herminiimonas arsenitoxidans TaxID=1809410 RepID=UPI0009714982|nr:hypothetical protein [Herminiimonas arsenitoxidans]